MISWLTKRPVERSGVLLVGVLLGVVLAALDPSDRAVLVAVVRLVRGLLGS